MTYQHRILEKLSELNFKVNIIMATLQDISNAVSAETQVDNSIVTLLNGIVQQLKDAQASNDPAAMDAVVASIQANTKILSDAVTANTPAAPAA
jgi:uncharacterized coiled-coil protein SlyX